METFWQAYISISISQKSTYKPNREDTKKAEVKDKGWRTVARDRRRGGRLYTRRHNRVANITRSAVAQR